MSPARRRGWIYILIVLGILVSVAGAELAMGRVPWCKCGYIKLWHGVVQSSENSQHLTDWYTLTHVIHGVLFYAVLWLFARWIPPGPRFVIAVALEGLWEVIENSSFIIERYRAQTLSLDYYGDSVVNSLSDIVAMIFGYWLTRVLPTRIVVLLVVVIEVALAIGIRDNLTLNILMLIHPFAAIKRWQLGG
jgi:hypothetical protein